MFLSPKDEGIRPRLACEIAVSGVVAARSAEPGGPLLAVKHIPLQEDAVLPSLKPGNIPDRIAVIGAVKQALEAVGARANARGANVTLIIPDGAVRVLLLDFDALPNKLSEALPIVRFRLKKLVPFNTDEAMVSFQIMSSARGVIRVLAVAIPRDVLADYETVVREAGFEPGAVLPSTLAVLAGIGENEAGSLVVNAHRSAVTTAIVRGGTLLLHRTVELLEHTEAGQVLNRTVPALDSDSHSPFEAEPSADQIRPSALLPLVSLEDSVEEWAAQQPLPEFGRNPYADAISAEEAVETSFGVTSTFVGLQDEATQGFVRTLEPTPDADPQPPIHLLAADVRSEEIARAVSVAVAYFEDLLSALPDGLLSAGPEGAAGLQHLLHEQGVLQDLALPCHEVVTSTALAAEAATAAASRGVLAGVMGALRS